MKKEYTLRQKIAYHFDNLMAKGPIAMIGLLALASLAVVLIAGIVILLFNIAPKDSEPLGFIEGTWQSLMATLDSGTMGGDEGWSFRWVRFFVTLGGIFIISTLIGVLSSGIESKLDSLRKGKSQVIENGHTLILGWSPKILYIIKELQLANKNTKESCIVIMAEKDKVEMEEEIQATIENDGITKIICRNASPHDINDLKIVNPDATKSIIILSSEQYTNPDAQVIKTILALTNNPKRSSKAYHIVAEIQNQRNVSVAKMVGKKEIEVVLSGDVITSIMVQTCRHSGLSGVFTELLDFGGDEIYFKNETTLAGKKFKEILNLYDTSSIIGLCRQNDEIILNPDMDTVLLETDQLIAISADDNTINPSSIQAIIQKDMISHATKEEPQPEKILLLGWNQRGIMMVEKMDAYVAKGSTIKIIAQHDSLANQIQELSTKLKNIQIKVEDNDITNRNVLDQENMGSYTHIFLLAYSDQHNTQEADAITLISLLHLRNMSELNNTSYDIASEILDVNNRELATITQANDFIVSENYISLMLSQISENKQLNKVFSILFSSEGSELYIKDSQQYVLTGKPVNFNTIVASAAAKSEIAIGYKIASEKDQADNNFGIYVNPKKSETITLQPDDKIIVIANQ